MERVDISSVAVVIPVHNEQELLPGCLASVLAAADAVTVPVWVVVALDRCEDASREVVAAFAHEPVRSIEVTTPGVGAARAAGFSAASDDLALVESRAERIWLATTDADSLVPVDWLSRQLDHAAHGADMVVGTVYISDWSEHPTLVRDRYLARYSSRPGHRHMHGANLSFRASAYREVGGFSELRSGEDVDLIERFEQDGRGIAWAADVAVLTSGRRAARAPLGFAHYLRALGHTP